MKPTGVALLAAGVLAASAGAAAASGPINAEPPPAGDGPAFQSYATAWLDYQYGWELRLFRAFERWENSREGSRAERAATRQFSTATRKLRAGQRAVTRDLASTGFGAGCKKHFLADQNRAFAKYSAAARSMSRGQTNRVFEHERDGTIQFTRAVGRAYQMADCLDQQGWNVPPVPAMNDLFHLSITDAFYLKDGPNRTSAN